MNRVLYPNFETIKAIYLLTSILYYKKCGEAIGTGSKGQKKADMEFIPYPLFSVALPHTVMSKCAFPDSF